MTRITICRNEGDIGLLIDVVHLHRLLFPIISAVLNNAKRINPEISHTKPSRDCDCILVVFRQSIQRNVV